MKRNTLIGLAIVAFLVLIIGGSIASTYNRLVALEQTVQSQWAQVENVYQRRADLVPSLVATVRGAAAHERETLQAVTEARTQVVRLDVGDAFEDPQALARYEAAQGQLSMALSRLLAVAEAYPQIRANENFLALQSQLEGTENRITVERMRYNDAARQFNTARASFPANMFANMFGERFAPKVYFQADAAAAVAPLVEF
jgi:LemA protein